MQFCQRGPDGLHLPQRCNRPLRQPQLDDDRHRLPKTEGSTTGQRRCQRSGIVLLAHTDYHASRPEEIRRVSRFLTSPGYLTGPGTGEAAGLPKDTGPHRVITELAVLGFHCETKRMMVLSLHPGKTLEEVKKATSFALEVAADLQATTRRRGRITYFARGSRSFGVCAQKRWMNLILRHWDSPPMAGRQVRRFQIDRNTNIQSNPQLHLG